MKWMNFSWGIPRCIISLTSALMSNIIYHVFCHISKTCFSTCLRHIHSITICSLLYVTCWRFHRDEWWFALQFQRFLLVVHTRISGSNCIFNRIADLQIRLSACGDGARAERNTPLGRYVVMPLIIVFKLNARLSRSADSRGAGANVARINHAPRATTLSPRCSFVF